MSALTDLPAGQSVAGVNNELAIHTFVIDVDSSSAATSPTLVVGDNVVEIKNGTNPQTVRVFNTDDGAGNTEYLEYAFSSNQHQVFSRSAGSGTRRQIRLGGIQLEGANNNLTLLGRATMQGGMQGAGNGSNPVISYGSGGFDIRNGSLHIPNCPTSDPANAGEVWSDNGTLKISAG